MARGYEIDFAYYGHEDEIYRIYEAHPRTDMSLMVQKFRNVFYIEPGGRIKVKTRAKMFYLDDWYSDRLDYFVSWYFHTYCDCAAALVNYVFLSAALESMPDNVVKIIDTHDRFYDRQAMYVKYRGEPNFFYTGKDEEAKGLSRADYILAIQDAELEYFSNIVNRPVYLFPYKVGRLRKSVRPSKIRTVGFIGHGNDPNLASISPFIHLWSARTAGSGGPVLRIAGEVCSAFRGLNLPNVQFLGYCDSLDEFYAQTDIVVAPLIIGTGLKIKTVEALAYGKPVIGTRIAFEGLRPRHPAHQLTSLEAVADGILKCVLNEAALDELCAACESIFERYLERSQSLEDEFFQAFNARYAAVSSATEAAPEPTTDTFTITLSRLAGGGAVWQETGPNSLSIDATIALRTGRKESSLRGLLIATEKRIASAEMDHAELERAFLPSRTRWFLGAEEPVARECIREAARCDEIASLDDIPDPDFIVIEPNIVELLESAPLEETERAHLLAKLLAGRASWSAFAERVSIKEFSLELTTLLPSRLPLEERATCGVLTTHVKSDLGKEQQRHYRLDVTRSWFAANAWESGQGATVREGTGLIVVPAGLNLRSFQPIVGRLHELRLLYRGNIGLIPLADN